MAKKKADPRAEIQRDRLRAALRAKGVTAAEASRWVSTDSHFVGDFLGCKKQTMNAGALAIIAKRLGEDPGWLLGVVDGRQQEETPAGLGIGTPVPQVAQVECLLPVYGESGAGDCRFDLTAQPINEVACPPVLDRVRGAYALSVRCGSMEPRLRSGDLVYVDPSRAPRRGDDVVVRLREGQVIRAYIREFVSLSGGSLVTCTLTPSQEIRTPTSEVEAIHCVRMVER